MKRPQLLANVLRVLLLAGGISVLLAALCFSTAPASAESWSFVRLVHASPDVGTVDVFVDGKKLLSSFQFASVTDYVPLPAGSHSMTLALIGKGIDAAVITQNVEIQPGTAYTVAAVGRKASGLSLTVFADNNAVAGTGARVRIYHLAIGADPLDVATQSTTVISDLSYSQASNYVDIPAGAYTFTVKTHNMQDGTPVSATLKPWTVTSVFAIDTLSGSSELQFVAAQVKGMPGMPGTGSDPRSAAQIAQPEAISGSILMICAVFCLAGGVITLFLLRQRGHEFA